MLCLKDNPPVAFPQDTPVDLMEGTWWVAHTKARQEKAFAWDLVNRGVSYFLPMSQRVRIIRGRKVRPVLPLFPSYVFVCGDEGERLEMFSGRRLAGTLRVADQRGLAAELLEIQKALAARAPLVMCAALKTGRRCRVTAGPFKGIEGIVERVDGSARLVMSVRSLGQGACLEIDASLLEPVD